MSNVPTVTVYKCSKCHKAGHNVRRCGKKSPHRDTNKGVLPKNTVRFSDMHSSTGKVPVAGEVYEKFQDVQKMNTGGVKTRFDLRPTDYYLDIIGINDVERGKFQVVETRKLSLDVGAKSLTGFINESGKQFELLYENGEAVFRSFNGEHTILPKDKGFVFVLKDKGQLNYAVMTLNREGLLHSFNGNPARVKNPGTGDMSKEWKKKGTLHNTHGPAVIQGQDRTWWVEGEFTMNNELCEKAISNNTTEDELYELCQNEDYVVRQLAVENPNSPEEWKVVAELFAGTHVSRLRPL